MRLRAFLRPVLRLRRSPPLILLLCAAAIVAAGLADLVIPNQVYFGSLFLAPILIAVRFCGRRVGVLLCLAAAAFWVLDAEFNAPAGLSMTMVHWLLIERLALFLFVTLFIDALFAGAKRSGRLLAHERRALRTKSEMLSLVSHELNNSMTMIGFAVRQLEIQGGAGGGREQVCGIVKRNVCRMRTVAQNFLSEARLAAGPLKLRTSPERLDAIVAGVIDALRPLADEKGISLSWRVVPRELEADVDRDVLDVALTNLVGNAIKYTPDRGRVAVDVRLRAGPPRRASVCVEDNGIGIAAEDQARVASAFERAEPGKRTAPGFGLGLKIAHDIVRAHGGTLALESRPGKGSKFSFLLRA
ncbi:MAG TPA: HAMP domain-containing sensor histidine kinase [Elusimicrobiota bacterium]|nr:HAMP domain-containing sensor histidine kinase [Elusimicrobiota bacterium]